MKMKKSFSRKKYIFFKFQLDKSCYYKKNLKTIKYFLGLAKCSQQLEKYEDEILVWFNKKKKHTLNFFGAKWP